MHTCACVKVSAGPAQCLTYHRRLACGTLRPLVAYSDLPAPLHPNGVVGAERRARRNPIRTERWHGPADLARPHAQAPVDATADCVRHVAREDEIGEEVKMRRHGGLHDAFLPTRRIANAANEA